MDATSNHRPPVAEIRVPERSERGFTMIETLIAMLLLLIVMGGVMESMLQFSRTQTTVWNRANMHGAVRGATELLQQEVGQAGRVALPSILTTSSSVLAPMFSSVSVSSTSGMFVGEYVVVDTGSSEETVAVSAVDSGTSFSATFALAHASNVPVDVRGGFASGVVPCANQASCPGSSVTTGFAHGSTSSVLKIYGDLNDDGVMKYVEYVCDTVGGNLYRNMMSFASPTKSPVSASQVLLSNILRDSDTALQNARQPGSACFFTYDQKTVNGVTFVVNVAVSLTTKTQVKDPVTSLFQTETKALLNVAPRNVFDAWQLASIGASTRIQPMPSSVANLIQ
jgi:prepilin-type N-terminal cleavage/methylation domain-containing protein